MNANWIYLNQSYRTARMRDAERERLAWWATHDAAAPNLRTRLLAALGRVLVQFGTVLLNRTHPSLEAAPASDQIAYRWS